MCYWYKNRHTENRIELEPEIKSYTYGTTDFQQRYQENSMGKRQSPSINGYPRKKLI